MTENCPPGDADAAASFTGFHKALEVRIYKNSGALDGDGPALFPTGQ